MELMRKILGFCSFKPSRVMLTVAALCGAATTFAMSAPDLMAYCNWGGRTYSTIGCLACSGRGFNAECSWDGRYCTGFGTCQSAGDDGGGSGGGTGGGDTGGGDTGGGGGGGDGE